MICMADAVKFMVAAVGGVGVPIVKVALLLSVPTVAEICTMIPALLALNVAVATPEALVEAATVLVPPVKEPAVPSLTANVTVVPDTGVEPAPRTVAVTVTAPVVAGVRV